MPRSLYGVTRSYYYSSLEQESSDECWTCVIIPITFWIFVSLTLILGLYGSSHLVLGPNYSHLLEANSIFVNEIQVRREGQEGPTLYGFSHRPKLDVVRNWTMEHTLRVDPEYHQEFAVWLNKGSKIKLQVAVQTYGFLDLLVVIVKGGDGLQEWIHDPTNSHLAVVRLQMHGRAEAEYVVPEDANYYFAVGNFNQRRVELVMRMNFSSKMYDTETANYKCSLDNGLCGVKMFFPGSTYALLTTATNTTDSMTVWYVELSYGARVVTYIIILGVIILLVYFILKYLGHMDHSPPPPPQEVVQSERSPLLHSKESTSESSTYGTIKQDSESGLLSSTEDLYDGKICVICYDELRNCFFIPCGHCATCYTCGQRIENGENKSCPICRQGIYRARRMFNV
eukprot:Gb_23472 [translate_table: standard]